MEKNEIRCWIAPRDITPGASFAEAIIDGIKGSKVFVLVYSSNSNQSHQVIKEVDRAVHHGLAIIPLRLEDVLKAAFGFRTAFFVVDYRSQPPVSNGDLLPRGCLHLDAFQRGFGKLLRVHNVPVVLVKEWPSRTLSRLQWDLRAGKSRIYVSSQ